MNQAQVRQAELTGTFIEGAILASFGPRAPMSKTTVIGHLPDYVDVAKDMGANYLKPTANWNWHMQGEFVKQVIKSGDDVFIGTSIRTGPSVLKHEIKQLIKAGYKPIEQGSKWLIKGVEL